MGTGYSLSYLLVYRLMVLVSCVPHTVISQWGRRLVLEGWWQRRVGSGQIDVLAQIEAGLLPLGSELFFWLVIIQCKEMLGFELLLRDHGGYLKM